MQWRKLMREVDRRSKYSRRIFLQGAAAAAPVVAVATGAGFSIEDAWADDATALAPSTLKTLAKVARDIYPHDFLVDGYYITAIRMRGTGTTRPTPMCHGRPTGSCCCRASNKPTSSRSCAPTWSSRST